MAEKETSFVAIGQFIYWRGDLLLEVVGGSGDKNNCALGITKALNDASIRAGSAETGGEKAAPFTLEITKEEEGWYCWVTWQQGASFTIGESFETRHGAEEHMGIIRKMLATFPRTSQNQTVASGVEGAHEGTTADKSGSREPEKLNNAQKGLVQLNEPQKAAIWDWGMDDRLWRSQETVLFNLEVFARKIVALAESSLSHHSKYPTVRNVTEAREKVASLSSPPPEEDL